MTETPLAAEAGPITRSADETIGDLARLMVSLGRTDLAVRAQAAAARLRRPNTVVCVVGEFKQGKSSLVNALLGTVACPVDDDLATAAVTLVRFGESPAAMVKCRHDGQQSVTSIPISDVREWVSESGNPHNHKGVERVEMTLPSALLRQGLVLVDTPGAGGLSAGQAAATTAFLPFADGLLFVSDASAELSGAELDFLRSARQLCPTVLLVQTKVDLYPAWPRIVAINRAHLSHLDVDIPIVAVSSVLRFEALRRKDRALNERSRVPDVVKHLSKDVVTPAKATVMVRSVGDALSIIDQVARGLATEKAAALDPDATASVIAELDVAKLRLEYLRGPAAKWATLVGDRVNELSNTATFQLRSASRQISRMMDDRIEELAQGDEWDELARYLQDVVAEEVAKVFVMLEQGRVTLRADVIELLRDEQVYVNSDDVVGGINLIDNWSAKQLDAAKSAGKKAVTVGLTTIRGAQGGITMLGMLGNLLPAAAGGLMASNPVLLGVGALFGSMGLAEDRKRKVTARRQAARAQMRQLLDDVQFDVGNQVAAAVRAMQRDLRDEFGDRLGELITTCTETAQNAQLTAKRTVSEREAAAARLDKVLAALEACRTQIALVGEPT
jgi:hypothetical protein